MLHQSILGLVDVIRWRRNIACDCCQRYLQTWRKSFPWSGDVHHGKPSIDEEGIIKALSKTTDTFCKIISGRKYVFFFWHHSMLSIMEHSIFLPQILCMACLFYSKKKKRFLRVAPTSESSFSNQWYEAIPFHPIKLSICCKRMCSYLHSPWSCCTDTKYISKLSLFFLSCKNLIYLSS